MCNCGSSFPANALDQTINFQSPAPKSTKVVITPSDGITVTSTETVDAQGNVTYKFDLAVAAVGPWRDLTVGANGQAAARTGTRLMRTRTEKWPTPSFNGADLGPGRIVNIDGSYIIKSVPPGGGGPTPPLADGTWYHIATVAAEHLPAKAAVFPCALVKNEASWFPTFAEVRANGQVWAMFADPLYDSNATYIVELHTTYPTEV